MTNQSVGKKVFDIIKNEICDNVIDLITVHEKTMIIRVLTEYNESIAKDIAQKFENITKFENKIVEFYTEEDWKPSFIKSVITNKNNPVNVCFELTVIKYDKNIFFIKIEVRFVLSLKNKIEATYRLPMDLKRNKRIDYVSFSANEVTHGSIGLEDEKLKDNSVKSNKRIKKLAENNSLLKGLINKTARQINNFLYKVADVSIKQ